MGASEQWEAVSTVPLSAGVKPLLEPASLQRPGPATTGFLRRAGLTAKQPPAAGLASLHVCESGTVTGGSRWQAL